jgi:hypothetical protein
MVPVPKPANGLFSVKGSTAAKPNPKPSKLSSVATTKAVTPSANMALQETVGIFLSISILCLAMVCGL